MKLLSTCIYVPLNFPFSSWWVCESGNIILKYLSVSGQTVVTEFPTLYRLSVCSKSCDGKGPHSYWPGYDVVLTIVWVLEHFKRSAKSKGSLCCVCGPSTVRAGYRETGVEISAVLSACLSHSCVSSRFRRRAVG